MSQVYFTDRDLGKTVPNALAAAGYSVERHQRQAEGRARAELLRLGDHPWE